jgi:hypothetical protein
MVSDAHFGQPHIKSLAFGKGQRDNVWNIFTGIIKVSHHYKYVTFVGAFLKRVM